MLAKRDLAVVNIDVTLALQAPKVAEYLPKMKQTVAETLGILTKAINIKATTTEQLGFVGRKEGIVCHAVCLVSGAI